MAGSEPLQVVDVGREAIKQGLSDGSITLVDVREPHEYAAGHIPGSVSQPLSSFDPVGLQALSGRVVFSCAAGVRSLHAIEFAQANGLDLHEHYRGGFKDWALSGERVA